MPYSLYDIGVVSFYIWAVSSVDFCGEWCGTSLSDVNLCCSVMCRVNFSGVVGVATKVVVSFIISGLFAVYWWNHVWW